MKHLARISLVVAVFLAVSAAGSHVDAAEAKIQPSLLAHLDGAADGELFRVFVLLEDQVDRYQVAAAIDGLGKIERRRRAIEALRDLANRAQAPLIDELERLRDLGQVGEIRPLWIANLVIAEADAFAIRAVADHPAVRLVHRVRPYAPGEATDAAYDGPTPVAEGGIEPNLSLINAPPLWLQGYEGQSVIIANIDTGVNYNHNDLENHIWRNIDESLNGMDDDGNGFVDDIRGWDFENNDNDPNPCCSGHGTNTAGIVIGDGTSGTRTGIASQAVMIPLQACGEEEEMEAVQYAVMNGAELITSSCSYKFPSEPAYAVWREIAENELLAGVTHANSIGNQGRQQGSHPIPYNISAPAIAPSAWLHPDQMILGGLGSLLATGGVEVDMSLYLDSGRGPSAWEDIQNDYPNQQPIPPEFWDYPWNNGNLQGLLKPDVVMPTNVKTTAKEAGYINSFGGTSAATPHTGGAAALLLSTAPNLTPAGISEALQSTALDLGDPGKDGDFGGGLPDILAAARSVWPDVTPIVEPFGQAVLPGDSLSLDLALKNNTDVAQTVDVSLHVFNEGGEIPASPVAEAEVTLAAQERKTATFTELVPPDDPTQTLVFELRVGRDGATLASKEVEVFIRPPL